MRVRILIALGLAFAVAAPSVAPADSDERKARRSQPKLPAEPPPKDAWWRDSDPDRVRRRHISAPPPNPDRKQEAVDPCKLNGNLPQCRARR